MMSCLVGDSCWSRTIRLPSRAVSIKLSALKNILNGGAGLASDVAHLSPELGQMPHARIAEDGHNGMTGSQIQRCLQSCNAYYVTKFGLE